MSQARFDTETRRRALNLYKAKASSFGKEFGAYIALGLANIFLIIVLSVIIGARPPKFYGALTYIGASIFFLVVYSAATTKTLAAPISYRIAQVLKRLFDVMSSALGLLILMPCFVIIAVLIRKDSPGPIFFRSKRVGQFGAPIYVLKFRTMYVAPTEAALTPIGRWLRETYLNELPNLFNVLKGDLSLIGPYPRTPEMAAETLDKENRILTVRPGMAGLWSVSGAPSSEMAKKDLLYIRYWNFWLDVDILLTVLQAWIPNLRTKR